MDDYYSLLGIDADATVDDIRGAYRVRKDGLDTGSDAGRADAVKLNKAWNVLSDPYQRGRYDEQRASAAEEGTLGVDDGSDDAKPSTNGSESKGLRATAKNSRQARQQSVREARLERLKNSATITPPAGTRWPTTKERIIAMVIDLFVIIVLVSGSQIAASAVAKSQKPAVVKQVDSYNTQINDANKAKSDADSRVSADKKANNTTQQAVDQKASDDAKANVTALTKKRDDEEQKLAPYYITGIAVAFFLGFLYLAIPSAMTGRTLGKRFQHLKVLREDGSPLGVRGAVVRWGSIVLVTFVLYYVLQQIAAVVVLFGVTMWMRNANKQGLHDRIAHTIVVSDAAD
jgi:curved DNA-binding protein CbpA